MSDWLTDYQVFLYAKGTGPDDVFLRRCKKPLSSSSLVVPMKSDDFDDDEINVKNHVELIKDQFDWDETDYKRLVKYIYERLLLVNRQGLVIAKIYKLDDANAVPIYIRSLDVLPLKDYIPKMVERRIPLRTVKYLEDVKGEAAKMEDGDSNMAKRVADLELKNKTLEGKVTESNAEVADLELKNKTLEGKVTKLIADLEEANANYKEVWMNDLTNSEWVGVEGLTSFGPYEDVIILSSPGTFTVDDSSTNVQARYCYKININGSSQVFKAVSLEDLTPNKERARFSKGIWWSAKSKGKTYVALYSTIIHPNNKEVWMNGLTNSDWVGVEGLEVWGSYNDFTIVGSLGTFTVDDSSTNVQARYWCKIKFGSKTEYKAVFIEDMTPNKEKARFSQGIWWSNKSKDGKTYAYRWL